MKSCIFACSVICLITSSATTYAWEFRHTLTNATAFGKQVEGDAGIETIKFENTLRSELSHSLNNNWQLSARWLIAFETRDLIEPGEPDDDAVRSSFSQRLFFNDYTELDLREIYIDGYVGDTFLRFGKQQVVWGQADGFRVLDAINPMNLREFILEESEDRRIPTWMLNVELPIGSYFNSDWNAQLLWIPDTTYDQVPSIQQRALFAPSSPRVVPYSPQATAVTVQPADKPNRWLSDSDIGLRINSFIADWDISLHYLYHYLDRPAPYQTTSVDLFAIAPGYERSHLFGLAASSAIQDFTLRTEIALHSDRFYITTRRDDNDGIFNSTTLDTVIGLDYNGISDTLISAQLFVSHIVDVDSQATRDQNDVTFTLIVERDFYNQTLTLGSEWLHNANDGDGLLRVSAEYQWRSNVSFVVGVDAFYGNESGTFGQFDQRDQITGKVVVGF